MPPSHGEPRNTNDQVMPFTPNWKADDKSMGDCRPEAENVLRIKGRRIVGTTPAS